MRKRDIEDGRRQAETAFTEMDAMLTGALPYSPLDMGETGIRLLDGLELAEIALGSHPLAH